MFGIDIPIELALVMLGFYLFPVVFVFLWLISYIKKLFFWVWFWQLKEYHLGRFFDHFRTKKGKDLIFGYPVLLKMVLIWFLLIIPMESFPYLIPIILISFLIYLFEALTFGYKILKKTFKKPVLTKKTLILVFTGLMLGIGIIWYMFRYQPHLFMSEKIFYIFLALDILIPLIISGLVLAFQPLTVFLRNKVLQKARLKRREFKDLIVVGITGSYGKSSVKEFLSVILSKKYKVLKTEKNQNSEIGISQCILDRLNSDHEVFVCEMGAYNKGGIKLLAGIAKPEIGIITGINEQHLSTFGSLENVIKTKFELIDFLPSNGLAILNNSNPFIKKKSQNIQIKKKLCSVNEKLDVWAENIIVKPGRVSFKAFSKSGDSADFSLNLNGAQNIENLLLAISCSLELGMSMKEISLACKKIKPFSKTMELRQGINKARVIDDSYSANPQGVMAALDYLNVFKGKKILIMPCLIELGSDSKKIHEQIGEKIGKICDLAIITTKDRFKQIRIGAVGVGMNPENIVFLENSKDIFEKIKPDLNSGSTVLLESRVPEKLIGMIK